MSHVEELCQEKTELTPLDVGTPGFPLQGPQRLLVKKKNLLRH